jgi:hypothetical protein
MASVLECTTEEQHSFVFLWEMGLSAKDILFRAYGGSVCCTKRFSTWSINPLEDVRKSQMMPDHARKWLRQQSKALFASGFDALVKRWVKCINVGAGFVEK